MKSPTHSRVNSYSSREMDKIHFVGISAEDLTAEQRNKLESIVKHTEGLLGLNCYSNLDTLHSEDDMPLGISLYFDPNAIVDPSIMSDRLFETVAISKVLAGPYSQELSDQHFSSLLPEITAALPQHAADPAPLRGAADSPWAAELGGVGSFVGAYSELKENHRDKDYYIAARGTAPLMVQELKNLIAQERPVYRDLLYGSQAKNLKQAKYIASQNVRRGMAQVAETCRVEIRRGQDLSAKVRDAVHEAQPELAVPEWTQETHSIQSVMYNGKPAIAFYYGVVPKETCQQYIANSKGTPYFVVASPFDGIRGFPLTKPIEDSALVASAPRSAAQGAETLKNGELAKRTSVIVWEGKGVPHDIHPQAFKPVNKKAMSRCGWSAKTPVRTLIPVAVKIYDIEQRRE